MQSHVHQGICIAKNVCTKIFVSMATYFVLIRYSKKTKVSQRTEIKRQKALIEKLQKEEDAERERTLARARERAIRDFNHSQTGLGKATNSERVVSAAKSEDSEKSQYSQKLRKYICSSYQGMESGLKRKFDFDAESLEGLTRDAEASALEQILKEQV